MTNLQRDDDGELPCASCGLTTSPDERMYAFGVERGLCFDCAVSRGGFYDEDRDRWTIEPRVEDLVRGRWDEARM
jgi:hypothetical protein